MATVERYRSFEEMEKAEQAEIHAINKSVKKVELTTIQEFASLLRINVVAKSQTNIKKPK